MLRYEHNSLVRFSLKASFFIDIVLNVFSDVVMNIIEDENKTSDTNQAVCSVTEGHQLYPLIVTYRCQANTQRIEVNLRSGLIPVK